jgi:hypothetical protein
MYPRYIPYLENQELYAGLKEIDNRFTAFRFMPFYSMGHMGQKYFQASLYGWLGREARSQYRYKNGYFSFPNKEFNPTQPPARLNDQDSGLSIVFDSISTFCKQNKLELHVVIPPVHQMYYNSTTGIEKNINKLKLQCEKNNIYFYNYCSAEFMSKTEFFYDGFHLNNKGSKQFTRSFSLDLHNKKAINSVQQ